MAVYALVSTSYPRHSGDPGGHFVRAEARRRAAEGHEVHVVCPGSDRADGAVKVWGAGGGEAFGWPGAIMRMRERPIRAIDAGSFCVSAARRLRALPAVDRFVAHFFLPSALLPPRDAPLEVVGHGTDLSVLVRLPAPARALVIDRLLERGATFRFSSAKGRDQLARALAVATANRMLGRSRIELPAIEVPEVDAAARRRRRAELGGDGRPLVALCGRLVPGKRFDLALDAVSSAGACAVVIGDGPARASLERRAAEQGMAAQFVGQRLRDDALLDVACADLLVHPSRDEGASTVIREARALGVAVICCPSGDVATWAAEDEGIAVVGEDELAVSVRTKLA